jgi:hypothetical protein
MITKKKTSITTEKHEIWIVRREVNTTSGSSTEAPLEDLLALVPEDFSSDLSKHDFELTQDFLKELEVDNDDSFNERGR